MGPLLNNWTIIGVAFGLWLFSLLFLDAFVSDPIIGNQGYFVRTIGAAALPILATIFMYVLALRSAQSPGRSRTGVHWTYLAILCLLIPMMWGGMEGTLNADEPPGGLAVDIAAIAALVFGTVIFWASRGIQTAIRNYSNSRNA